MGLTLTPRGHDSYGLLRSSLQAVRSEEAERKQYSLEAKMEILQHLKAGDTTAEPAREFGRSSLALIRH